MSEKGNVEHQGKLSRRQFLKDAGLIVGGTAVSSVFLLTACGTEQEIIKTVTTTATTTSPGGTTTSTVTQSVTKYICPFCSQEFDSVSALSSHITTAHPGEGEIITKYVCPTCNEEFSSLADLKTHVADAHATTAANVVSFRVNGQLHMLQVNPWDTLRVVLREQLGLTSIKDMCYGYGACGSCTVIMDGRPILSCMTLACECEGAVIETTEGVAKAEHPLIEAYIKHHCMQCGYCTPGFVVTAKALLDRNPNPNEADIREALAGNLCRCATYIQHIPAVQEAAAQLGGG